MTSDALQSARDQAFAQYGDIAHLRVSDTRCTVSVSARTLDTEKRPIGFMGSFAGVEDLASWRTLLEKAFSWLAARGCAVVQGPITRHTWYPFRVVTEGFENHAPIAGEPWNTPQLPRRLAEAGFRTVARYASTWTDALEVQIDGGLDAMACLEGQGYRVRNFDPGRALDELRVVHGLIHQSFQRPFNYLFSPIDFEEFLLVLGPAGQTLDPGLFWICDAPDGSPAAFLYATDEGQGCVSIKTLTVSPAHRGTGLGSGLVARAHEAVRLRQGRRVIHALMRDGGPSVTISGKGATQVFRRYAVMERTL